MKKATISQTKNSLSAYLELVKRGETILILDRDRPIARLVPVEAARRGDDARLADLERLGVVRRAAQRPSRKLPPPVALRAGVSLLDALLQDREEARY
jgi:antitoxin (DNA-binding transcriptional repressor) of toxin-antitoxin stability system